MHANAVELYLSVLTSTVVAVARTVEKRNNDISQSDMRAFSCMRYRNLFRVEKWIPRSKTLLEIYPLIKGTGLSAKRQISSTPRSRQNVVPTMQQLRAPLFHKNTSTLSVPLHSRPAWRSTDCVYLVIIL